MKSETAGIIGYGVLGKAYAQAMSINMYIDKSDKNVTLKKMCESVKWIFLCVPTPPTKSGACDTKYVESWVRKVSKQNKDNVAVIKSTIIPGTAERLMEKYKIQIISCPEFLTESTAFEEAKNPDLIVIGAKDKSLAEEFNNLLNKLMSTYNPYVVYTDNKTAEFIKYSINSLYALKVVFANQLYDSAQREGIDYEAVVDAMYHRKWIGNNHLKVFHKGKRGYTGKCLPKDMAAFVKFTGSPLLKLAQKINREMIAGKDKKMWENILDGIDPKKNQN